MELLKYASLLVIGFFSQACVADHHAEMGDLFDQYLRSSNLKFIKEKAADYQYGRGTNIDLDKAIGLLCVAAHKGDTEAQYELGWIYFNRRHGRPAEAQAAYWLHKAAVAGDRYAKRLTQFVKEERGKDSERQCPLTSGELFLLPIESKPNPSVEEIQLWVKRLAPHYQLSPLVVIEVIRAESNFNVKAKSPKNAMGLMQLIPTTAKRFGVKDAWNPLQNIQGGMAYLQWLLGYFKGDLKLALAGYNAGEKAVDNYRGVPPYPETRRYVRVITQNLDRIARQKSIN